MHKEIYMKLINVALYSYHVDAMTSRVGTSPRKFKRTKENGDVTVVMWYRHWLHAVVLSTSEVRSRKGKHHLISVALPW